MGQEWGKGDAFTNNSATPIFFPFFVQLFKFKYSILLIECINLKCRAQWAVQVNTPCGHLHLHSLPGPLSGLDPTPANGNRPFSLLAPLIKFDCFWASYKWNQTVCSFLCLSSLAHHYYLCCAYLHVILFHSCNNIQLYNFVMIYLSILQWRYF